MAKVRLSKGKFQHIQACANERGIIAAAAMDQRGSLAKAIAKARGIADSDLPDSALVEFKTEVTRILTQHSSAILMDPEYGLPALEARAPGTGILLAYEKTGYDATKQGRLPDLLDNWSVLRLLEAGADAIKILLYYNPFDKPEVNDIKHAFIERVGAECLANDIPLFLEPVGYDPEGGDEKGIAYARRKPAIVKGYMEEFSKARYNVDILKVEVPINVKWTEGMRAFAGGEAAYTQAEAITHFREAASAAGKPFIYLSAGVSDEIFRETLELAAEANTPFSGVLCGRATWQDAIPEYGKGGTEALAAWLSDRGVANVLALNEVLERGAKPWYDFYGGLENIELV